MWSFLCQRRGEDLAADARLAEQLGFESVWVGKHFRFSNPAASIGFTLAPSPCGSSAHRKSSERSFRIVWEAGDAFLQLEPLLAF